MALPATEEAPVTWIFVVAFLLGFTAILAWLIRRGGQ
jgi:hypothetical protein